MNKQQGNTAAVSIVVIVVLALLGTLGYIAYQNFIVQKTPSNVSTTIENTTIQPVVTKKFTSQDHAITFSYPENWTVAEVVQEGATADWYSSSIDIKNSNGENVAFLGTGGQFGGMCDETAPYVNITTVAKDAVSLKGVGDTFFGYTIVQTDNADYGIAFGLVQDDIVLGDSSQQCPAMAINYDYIVRPSSDEALGSITFGLWYAESKTAGEPYAHKSFTSLADAKAYAESVEFKQIQSMIKSLSIGA